MMLDRMIGYSYCKHVMHSPLLHILLQKIRRHQQRHVPNRRSRCNSYTQKEFSKSERNQSGPFGDIRLKKKDATTVYNQSFTDTMKQRNKNIQLVKFVTELDSGVAVLTISRKQYKRVFIFRQDLVNRVAVLVELDCSHRHIIIQNPKEVGKMPKGQIQVWNRENLGRVEVKMREFMSWWKLRGGKGIECFVVGGD